MKEGGVRGMYRGFVPTLTGMVPYAGFSFYCFEYVKFFCMKYAPQWTCNKCDKNTGESIRLNICKLILTDSRSRPLRAFLLKVTDPSGLSWSSDIFRISEDVWCSRLRWCLHTFYYSIIIYYYLNVYRYRRICIRLDTWRLGKSVANAIILNQ